MKHLLSLLFLVYLNSLSFNLKACNCADPLPIEESYEKAEIIIRAKIISSEYVSNADAMDPAKARELRKKLQGDKIRLPQLDTKFIIELKVLVKSVYKGEALNDTLSIYTTRTPASCGATSLKPGGDYLIYAYIETGAYEFISPGSRLEKAGTFWTFKCTRNKTFSEEEAMALRALKHAVK